MRVSKPGRLHKGWLRARRIKSLSLMAMSYCDWAESAPSSVNSLNHAEWQDLGHEIPCWHRGHLSATLWLFCSNFKKIPPLHRWYLTGGGGRVLYRAWGESKAPHVKKLLVTKALGITGLWTYSLFPFITVKSQVQCYTSIKGTGWAWNHLHPRFFKFLVSAKANDASKNNLSSRGTRPSMFQNPSA